MRVSPSRFPAPPGKRTHPGEKAYYTDAETVEFVRPGLTITVNAAQIAADGTISVVYTVTPAGLLLNAAGVSTPGPIKLSYIAAVLSNNADEYTTYTTRSVSGPGAPRRLNQTRIPAA